ncbi:MAG: branched-chain amino acid ABC transporter permease [Gaiellaceae bacterium]
MVAVTFTWGEFFQQVVFGLAIGAVYASLALALVLIFRTTHVLNFAQGEMAMFTTFIAWSLITNHGFSFWPAFFVTIGIAFLLGAGVERIVIRRFEGGSHLTMILVTIGLFVIFNGGAAWIWSPEQKDFPSPFSAEPYSVGGVAIARQHVGILVVTLISVTVLWAFFRFTKAGLGMRAAAIGPEPSRLLGVRVPWMYAVGWGLAAALGAISGIMVAPELFLTPTMMQVVLIYAFVAAVLGGIESPVGAVVGGLLLGLGTTLVSRYVDFVSSELELPFAFAILVLVLIVRPAGLFGRVTVRRV